MTYYVLLKHPPVENPRDLSNIMEQIGGEEFGSNTWLVRRAPTRALAKAALHDAENTLKKLSEDGAAHTWFAACTLKMVLA
jgi:hypothetical protein